MSSDKADARVAGDERIHLVTVPMHSKRRMFGWCLNTPGYIFAPSL
jgi:hypothetical protein